MTVLVAYMDGVLCGKFTQSEQGDLRFHYDDAYRSDPAATPLSLSIPLRLAEHRKRVVLPFLDGLLTDSLAARQAMGRRFGVSPNNSFALLAHIGHDVAGALQLISEDDESTDAQLPRGSVTKLDDSSVADRLAAVIEEYETGATDYVGRFSLAGAQPKIALCRTPDGAWAEPVGSTPTTHILKPAVGRFTRLDLVEHMTIRAAAILGLNVIQTWLTHFGDLRVMVTCRYDRAEIDGRTVRLHQEDLGQSLSVSPDKKYQHLDGGPGAAAVGQLLSGLPRIEDRAPAAWAFWQGLAFNTVLHCTDGHIKNYSVLLSGRTVRLAPLYDLATYAPYGNGSAQGAMRVGEHYRFGAVTRDDYIAAARQVHVDQDHALDFVGDLRRGAVEAFAAARDEVSAMDTETMSEATRVLNAVAKIIP